MGDAARHEADGMSARANGSPDLVPVYFEGTMTAQRLRELLAPAGLVVVIDKAGRMVASPAPAFLAREIEPPKPAPRVAPFSEPERAPVIAFGRRGRHA